MSSPSVCTAYTISAESAILETVIWLGFKCPFSYKTSKQNVNIQSPVFYNMFFMQIWNFPRRLYIMEQIFKQVSSRYVFKSIKMRGKINDKH